MASPLLARLARDSWLGRCDASPKNKQASGGGTSQLTRAPHAYSRGRPAARGHWVGALPGAAVASGRASSDALTLLRWRAVAYSQAVTATIVRTMACAKLKGL